MLVPLHIPVFKINKVEFSEIYYHYGRIELVYQRTYKSQ